MRIGLVCPYDLRRPGGVQGQVLGLAETLSGMGEEVCVIGPGLPDDVPGVDLGPTVSVPGNRSIVPLSPDPRVKRRIVDAVSGLDLLHVHEPLMPMVSLSALRAGPPVVATFHAAPGRLGRAMYTLLRKRLRRLLGPNLAAVTAVSLTAAAPLPGSLDVTIVPNAVDLAAFDVDIARDPSQVAFLGRDEPRKGLDLLLRAWPAVRAARSEAHLVVMGADRGTGEVDWRGAVDDGAKAEVLASSGVFVAPNLGGESFGIVLVEAMAAGCAVIASDLDPFRDVAAGSARYFVTGDEASLSQALMEVLEDEGTRTELSAAGLERARLFGWDVVARRYRDVYRDAAS